MKRTRILPLIAGVAMLATAALPMGRVFAASSPSWIDDISTATISRTIKNGYGSIHETFNYTVTADSDNPTGATGAPTSATIVFNDTVSPVSDIKKTATLNFGSMQFEKIGDYSYVIREASSSNDAIYPTDGAYYTAIVSVRNNDTLTGFVASLIVEDSEGNKLNTINGNNSEVEFLSTPALTNIQVTATASGNAADPNKCFKYTIDFELPDYAASDAYTVNTTSTCDNPSSVTSGGYVSLKAGDSVTIGLSGTSSQIPNGTAYSISKTEQDDYTVSYDGVEEDSVRKTTAMPTDPAYQTENKTTINEELNSAVNTDGFISIAIYVVLAIAGGIGVFFAIKKKNQKEEVEA